MNILPTIFQLAERGVDISFRHSGDCLVMKAEHDGLKKHMIRYVSMDMAPSLRHQEAALELFLKDCWLIFNPKT